MPERLFFALPVEREQAQHIGQALEPVRESIDARWIPPENYHVTIAFLGATPESMIPDIIRYASEQLDIGVFPIRWSVNQFSHFRGGVLYLSGYQVPSAMTRLASELSFFVPLHERHANFIPHITLARDAPHVDAPALDLTLNFNRLCLFRSVPSGTGVRYEPLHSWG